ncbi:MAG: NAD-dependent epimerase/dehydratase family protein [Phycisphaeraceae bacterium]
MTEVDRNGKSDARKERSRTGDGSARQVGLVEWLRPGEHERVDRLLSDLRQLGVKHLRTGVSWADYHTGQGQAWYDWLLPRLASEVEVLPCFLHTPASRGILPRPTSPPRDPKAYADFIDVFLTRLGEHFEWVELWNDPHDPSCWDRTLDPEWMRFCQMVGGAAYWCKQRGKKTVLPGTRSLDEKWIELMGERRVLEHVDAVGLHGFPGTWDYAWEGWPAEVARARKVLRQCERAPELWITETGFSTWRHEERGQLRQLAQALEAPVERIYWYAARDLDPGQTIVDGFQADERDCHLGLKDASGNPKLLGRLWASGGLSAVQRYAWMGEPSRHRSRHQRPVLVTGGAGFVGANVADRLLESGKSVVLLDNVSRPGVEQNAEWLRQKHGKRVQIEVADIRDAHALRSAVRSAEAVYHFAAQVAVTTSLTGPIEDFDVNARGTLNLLEAIRSCTTPPPLLFTSTNKVYGQLDGLELAERGARYEPVDREVGKYGVGERALDFHSPYGCSKGAADQYVLDYARTFDLPTTVFRMSCIYGPHQFGTEDQGWVAHFLRSTLEEAPLTLYGDGKQVRDVLFIDDLVRAMMLAIEHIDRTAGQAYNIGGGPQRTVSLLELMDLIEDLHGRRPEIHFDDWRSGDQRYYVSDIRRFQDATGWRPETEVRDGVARLYEWLADSPAVAQAMAATQSLAEFKDPAA